MKSEERNFLRLLIHFPSSSRLNFLNGRHLPCRPHLPFKSDYHPYAHLLLQPLKTYSVNQLNVTIPEQLSQEIGIENTLSE